MNDKPTFARIKSRPIPRIVKTYRGSGAFVLHAFYPEDRPCALNQVSCAHHAILGRAYGSDGHE